MKTLTICGSMRFEKQMRETALKLETECGFNIIQCTYNETGKNLSYDDVEKIAEAHYHKIDISDGIYVMDIGGYIGKSVNLEIDYAKSKGKEIIYHSDFVY